MEPDGQSSAISVEQRQPSNFNSRTNGSDRKEEFSIIWHNLTYRADSRPWYTKLSERLSSRGQDEASQNGVSRGSGTKTILNQLCGDAKSSQLTAIMGPSGAGKSSLLHCLFQNRIHGTSGKILVDGGRDRTKLKVCFIPQKDYLNEWLTVREDLLFVSKLKLNQVDRMFGGEQNSSRRGSVASGVENGSTYVKRVGEKCSTRLIDHEANVHRVSELLGLNNCLDVPIKRISGGQKKRLSIARELMSEPDILILDEPTTGLDSVTCLKTIMVLRDLAHSSPNPMAVVVTIHQPQREVFSLFDKTYFLSNKGFSIYDEDPKRAVEIIENVAKLKLPVPNYNPASFLIEIGSDESQNNVKSILSLNQRQKFFEKYDPLYLAKLVRSKSGYQNWNFCSLEDGFSQSSFINGTTLSIDESAMSSVCSMNEDTIVKKVDNNNVSIHLSEAINNYYISPQLRDCLSSHSNNFLQSFWHIFILTHRSWLSVIRNPSFTKSRLIFHTLLPLMMLLVFGTHTGSTNNCPKLETQLTAKEMSRSLKEGYVSQNVEECRLTLENVSFFFILMYGFSINIISCTASVYPLTMQMFKKERINGLYSSGPYFIGQMLAEMPLEILYPTISILMSYQLSGQMTSYLEWRMFAVSIIVFLCSYSIHSLGLLCGSVFVNDVSIAVLFGQVIMLPFVILSGFLLRPSRMSEWMRQISVLTPLKNGITGVIAARYGFNLCDCDEEELNDDVGGVANMAPNVKHVIEYLFPKNETSGELPVDEMFDGLSKKFVKSQTFGLEIRTCDDVRPYLMHIYNVRNVDLFYSAGWLLLIIVIFKTATYFIMKSFPYRIS